MIELITKPCFYCQSATDAKRMTEDGISFTTRAVCPECVRKHEANESYEEKMVRQEKENKQAKKEANWKKVCPKLFLETDPKRLPAKMTEPAQKWKWGDKALAFIGKAGIGKTRSMFLLLKNAFDDGRTVDFISSVSFIELHANRFNDDSKRRTEIRERLERIKTVDVLFIDDIGKEKFTEPAEVAIFDLLNERTQNMLPTCWTSNCTGAELKTMLSGNRGEPTLRRLAEFSEVIK